MSAKMRLDIPLILPDVPDAADACVDRLIAELEGKSGVEQVHVKRPDGAEPQLCIHYDPETVSFARISELASSTGAKISERFGHLYLTVEGITHPRRARSVSEQLRQVKGVVEAEASASGDPDRIRSGRDLRGRIA